MNTAEFSALFESCKGCDTCRDACALLQREGNPAEIFADVEKARRSAYECTLCGRCEALCPPKLEIVEAFRISRRMLYSQGKHPRLRLMGGQLYQWLGKVRPLKAHFAPKGSKVAFFPGCNLSGSRPEAVWRLWSELEKVSPGLGLVFDCCMVLQRDSGDEVGFARSITELGRSLKAMGVETLISACPSCNSALETGGLEVELKSAFDLIDAMPFDAKVGKGTIRLHDACSTREDRNLHETVRRLVHKTGHRVENHTLEGDKTFCCSHAAFSLTAQEAETPYITYCGGCLQTLSKGVSVRHLFDLWFGSPDGEEVPGMARRLVNRFKLVRRFKARRPSPDL